LTLSVLGNSYDRPAESLRTGVTRRSDFAPTAGQFVAGLSWINVPLARRNSIENTAARCGRCAAVHLVARSGHFLPPT